MPLLVAPQPSNGSQSAQAEWLPLENEPAAEEPRELQPELEIGDVLAQVQRFADETAEEAEQKAKAIIESARAEATAIIVRAEQEASTGTVVRQPPVSPEAILTLCHAIEEFAETNRALVSELSLLSQALIELSPDTQVPAHRQASEQWSPVL
jgi:cell division septum initiation protein DivIVA